MKCTWLDCEGDAKVTHTYKAGPRGKTQRLVCEQCGRATTAVTLYERADGYGKGASARASKLLAQSGEDHQHSDSKSSSL